MSIVENLHFVRFIHGFLLILLANLSYGDNWQADLEQQLLLQWQQLTNEKTQASIRFIGVSDAYQLPQCRHDFSVRLVKPLQPGRNGVELSCRSPYWRQHLAVQLHVMQPVVVLVQALRNKALVSDVDVRLSTQDIGELSKGYFSTLTDAVGLQVKRSLAPGTILSPDMLELPLLIKRGQKVAIRLQRPGIQVEMAGVALAAGKQGQSIRVRNETSGKVINARVVARDLVQVQ